MKINEKDLFNFVFYRNLLDKGKADYIKDSRFTKEIYFLKFLKNAFSAEISTKNKRLIASRIPLYNNFRIFNLFPQKAKIKVKISNSLKLAADSAELVPQNTSQTFSDEKKNFLIKLISSRTETKLFVFSTKEEKLYNLNLTLEPHNLKFFMKDNSKPLEFKKTYDVQKITLEIAR